MSGHTAAEFDSLVPEMPFSRRGFLVTALGAGFALAVQPGMSATTARMWVMPVTNFPAASMTKT
jgi:hypothetical protein